MTTDGPTTFDFSANTSSFANWALAEALGRVPDKKIWDALHPPLLVTFSVNGVSLDFAGVMKLLDEEFQRLVDARAKEIVTEKFDDMLAAFRDGEDKVKSAMDDLLAKLENKG